MIRKVAIDTSPLVSGHKVRGIGVNTRELVFAFEKLSSGTFTFEKENIKIEPVDFASSNLSDYDAIHYQYFHPFFCTLPDKKPARKVVLTIHDLIPLIYPKVYKAGMKGKINFWHQNKNLKNIDRIITISETSKKDIVRFLSYPEDRIDVIYLAHRDIFRKLEGKDWKSEITKRYGLPGSFVLYVGDINYNKNISTLIKACDSLDVILVIVGKQALEIGKESLNKPVGVMDWVRFLFGKIHPEVAHLKELSNLFSKSKKVVRLGFVPDDDLVVLYNLATVYAQPSFYEGFGLPLLEAMACGTPVLASNIGAHKEIALDSALFFDPYSVSDLEDKLKRIIAEKNLREDLINKGFERVSNFSWEKTARNTLKVYEKVLF